MAEQEARVELLFRNIEDEFSALSRLSDTNRAESKLRTITGMLRDCKAAVKEYEREARVDGVPQAEILANKQNYVAQVNGYVRRKKDADQDLKAQIDLNAQANQASTSADPYPNGAGVSAPPSGAAPQKQTKDMTNQEIVTAGRDKMDATDAELAIARRVAAQTEQTAVGTAAQLKKQTEQMQNVASDLNEIEFTMKRASRVITDITRGLATDKCIMCLIFLVVAAIIAAIVLKITGVGDDVVKLPGPENTDRDGDGDEDDAGGDGGGGGGGGGNRRLLASVAELLSRR